MKGNNLIKQYIYNNRLNIEKVMNDFTPYIYTIISNKNSNLRDEDIEELISDVFLFKKIKYLENVIDISDYENNLCEIENIEMKTENNEKNNLIMIEINNMKQEDKEIFTSYYYYSKTMKEIAEQLKIKEEKVKSRLFRIRRKLKKSLEKRGYSYDR